MTGEKAVGAIVNDLSLSQPQVSKPCGVLTEVGLVKCRVQGRHRLHSLEPARSPAVSRLAGQVRADRGMSAWIRIDDYLKELQKKETSSGA